MRIKGAKQVHYDAGPNMTPLVDVVMVILIFLMLAGNFGDSEQYLVSSVPIRQKGVPVPNQTLPNDTELKIKVDAAGDRFFARLDGEEGTFTDTKALTDLLSTKLASFIGIGKKPEDIQVLISPGLSVKYGFTIQVYAAVLAAGVDAGGKTVGFTKVAFEQGH